MHMQQPVRNQGRRGLLPGLIGACSMLLAAILLSATPLSAEVPGKAFTATACQEHSDSVARLYTAGLDREPEADGFDYWIGGYTTGQWPLPRMANFFVASPEFTQLYGQLGNGAFVDQLYQNVLGREGEPFGVAYWTGELNSGRMSRARVLLRFSESPENITNSGTTQPALGEFNEGLKDPFVCGPNLTDKLLAPTGDWQLGTPIVRNNPSGDCSDAYRIHDQSVTRVLANSVTSDESVESLHPFPTVTLAADYVAEMRQALTTCTRFESTDAEVAYRPLEFPELGYGSETLAVQLDVTFRSGNITVAEATYHHIIVRFDEVVMTVTLIGESSVETATTKQLVDLAAEALTASPPS